MHTNLIRAAARQGRKDDIILAQIGVGLGWLPSIVSEVVHTVDAILKVTDGDGGPECIRALEKSDFDISGVVGRRDELPTDAPVVPVI